MVFLLLLQILTHILLPNPSPNIPYTYSPSPSPFFPLQTDHTTNTSIICTAPHLPHYLNLQIGPTASVTQVATAYRGLIRVLHPDKYRPRRGRLINTNINTNTNEEIVVDEKQNQENKIRAYALVRKAWGVLGTSAKRQAYTFGNYYLDLDEEEEEDEERESKDPFERMHRKLGGKGKQKKRRENTERGFVERVEGHVEQRLDCLHWVMGKERLVYGDGVDGNMHKDEDVDVDVDEMFGETVIYNDWKCWESALRDLDTFVERDEYNRRRSLWESLGSPSPKYPYPYPDPNHTIAFPMDQEYLDSMTGSIPTRKDLVAYMFGVEEEERKPWFWNYNIVPRWERGNCWGCVVGWVNLVHLFVDNLVSRERSDDFWAWVEEWRVARAVKEKEKEGEREREKHSVLVPKTLTFWEDCESFDVVIWVKEENADTNANAGNNINLGIGNGKDKDRWSNRRSDTRWSTLGSDLYCWDVMAVIWIMILLMIWVIGGGLWWVVRVLSRWVWKDEVEVEDLYVIVDEMDETDETDESYEKDKSDETD